VRQMPDHLRRLTVGPKKGTSHSVAISESCLLGDNVNRVVGVFHQRTSPLQAEVLDGLRRRLAGFGLKSAAKLAWRKMRDLGKVIDVQPTGKIAPRICEHGLNSIRLRLQLEKGRELRLPAGAAMVQDEPARNRPRRFEAKILFDQREGEINTGRHPG